MKGGIFFIAIVPEEPVQEEITLFKKEAATRFNSMHALRSPPHITLSPPFKWPGSQVLELEDALIQFASGEAAFELKLKNFDCFRPRVIFIDVEKNDQLSRLQQALAEHLAGAIGLESRDKRPYHPHMTIAFKDLKRSVFPQAWEYFRQQKYERQFPVEDIVLLRHNGKLWEVKRRYELGAGC